MPHISTLTLRRNQHPVFLAKHFTDRLGPCGYVEANSSLKRSSTGVTVSWISGCSSLFFFFFFWEIHIIPLLLGVFRDRTLLDRSHWFLFLCIVIRCRSRNGMSIWDFLMLFWGRDGRASTAKTLSGNRYPCIANMRVGKQGFTRF
jgi:hypothetical protein